jgi:hypothetical protein
VTFAEEVDAKRTPCQNAHENLRSRRFGENLRRRFKKPTRLLRFATVQLFLEAHV